MEYITELRGGYDEWSDTYNAIMGLRLETGNTIETRFIDDTFTDTSGASLEVELPPRIETDEQITIERYEPDYEYWTISRTKFEDSLDEAELTIDVESLN